jgi:putative flippase GtrA
MTLSDNGFVGALWRRLRSKVGVRFTRFLVVAGAALAATEIVLTICNGGFHLHSTPAALLSWFAGAVVSYVLSRWAWERKGRPDVLRETLPFWVISAMVIVVLTLANKFAYHSASWMKLTGAKQVLWVDVVWLGANFVTFLLRFVIFHYVLFAERAPRTAAQAAASAEGVAGSQGPGVPRPGTTHVTVSHPMSGHDAVNSPAVTTAPANPTAAPAASPSPNGTSGRGKRGAQGESGTGAPAPAADPAE